MTGKHFWGATFNGDDGQGYVCCLVLIVMTIVVLYYYIVVFLTTMAGFVSRVL